MADDMFADIATQGLDASDLILRHKDIMGRSKPATEIVSTLTAMIALWRTLAPR